MYFYLLINKKNKNEYRCNKIWALLFFLSSLSLFSLWQLGNVTITGRTANIMTPIERDRDKTLHGTYNFTSFLLKTQNTSTMVEELWEDLQLDYWQFLDSCSSWRQWNFWSWKESKIHVSYKSVYCVHCGICGWYTIENRSIKKSLGNCRYYWIRAW